ncbi:MAG: tetratricopeptide repeat protein [Chromatiaceae bacterium]|nr:tetratricopeptide repeat protein [Chromatiaceae bacterium]
MACSTSLARVMARSMPDFTSRAPGSVTRAALLLAVLGAMLLNAGCGGLSRSDRPAKVEQARGTAAAPAVTTDTQIAAYTPPAEPRIARPEPNRAVAVLMRRAEDQRRSGELDAATVSLERALRITPDDALLWQRLAGVRLAQQRHELVLQLAAKSNALAKADDRGLRSENWRLIAQSRRALGDSSGAREAERQAAALR